MDKTNLIDRVRRLLPKRMKRLLTRARGFSQGKWPLELAQLTLRKTSNDSTLTGKIKLKMAFDRNPMLTIFADKYLVREYVSEAIGAHYLSKIIATVGAESELESIEFPREFAFKSNNGSGAMILVWEGAPKSSRLPSKIGSSDWEKYLVHPDYFEKEKAINLGRVWLKQNFYYRAGFFPEWAYEGIKPALIVEELMLDNSGNLPADFKFFMIDGKCNFIQVDNSRFKKHTRDLYTPKWNKIKGSYKYPSSNIEISPPENLSEMLEIAETLSKGVDFVRVDLYETSQGVKFGELTNYPGGGIEKFTPKALDTELGKPWRPDYSI